MQQTYKRSLGKKTAIPPVERYWGAYGAIKTQDDPPWINPHLEELHEDAALLLHFFDSQVKAVGNLDTSEFKPDIAAAKKMEIIANAKKRILVGLKRHVEKYKEECRKVEQAILRVTQPDAPSDPSKATLQFLQFQEIRNLIRQTEPKKREEMVADNLLYLQALQGAPDNIIAKETLNRLRRDFAFKQDPSLREMEKDQELIYKAVRQRAADIHCTAIKILQMNKLDDPTSPQDYYDAFPPKTDHEAEYAAKRMQEFDRREVAKARRKEFEERQKGINLGVDEKADRQERAIRINRGIPHQ